MTTLAVYDCMLFFRAAARLRGMQRGLKFLTDFAVDIRYPSVRATKRQATSALRWAAKVRDACRALLNL